MRVETLEEKLNGGMAYEWGPQSHREEKPLKSREEDC